MHFWVYLWLSVNISISRITNYDTNLFWKCYHVFLDLIHLIDELSNLRILDIRGAQIKHTHISTGVKSQAFSAEDFCSRFKSPREQVLELRIGGKLIYVYLQNTIAY